MFFEAIYHGKGLKTPDAVAKRAGMTRKRVLEEGIKLVKQHIVVQEKDPKRGLLYGVDSFTTRTRSRSCGWSRTQRSSPASRRRSNRT